jgi:2,5-furandicarboxylate decarboxylase 1
MRDLRSFLDVLDKRGELHVVATEVDPRFLSPLLGESERALLFTKLRGYSGRMRAVGQVLATRDRCALAMEVEPRRAPWAFMEALKRPLAPEIVSRAPVLDHRLDGEPDLSALPIPVLHEEDGGPYISAGLVVSEDPVEGRNVGCYRLMYRTRNTTGIDLVSNSDLSARYRRAVSRGESLPIAIALGVHPCDAMAAAYSAPTGVDEFTIAGALKGEPLPLARLPLTGFAVPAYSEIAIEAELLPSGWSEPEGPFGEFQRVQGGVHLNPVVQINAIYHREDPIFQIVTHPWEGGWGMNAIPLEVNCLEALGAARVETTAITMPKGGVCFNVVAAVRKKPGQGKLAVIALLSTTIIKHAVVVDDDIDVFDHNDVEWAIATRVRADRDIIIVPDARGKPLDPSSTFAGTPQALATRWGIDATRPDGVDAETFRKFSYVYPDRRLEDVEGRS